MLRTVLTSSDIGQALAGGHQQPSTYVSGRTSPLLSESKRVGVGNPVPGSAPVLSARPPLSAKLAPNVGLLLPLSQLNRECLDGRRLDVTKAFFGVRQY